MLPVLVIDDNDAVCAALQVLLDLHDIPCVTASSPEQGLALAGKTVYGAIIQDMNFSEDNTSGEEGIRLFRALRKLDPYVPIFLITAWTSLESAVQLVKEGAYDYLSKPWDDRRLVAEIKKLISSRANAPSPEGEVPGAKSDLCGLVYADPVMHRVVTTALQVAKADVPILITGANGAGKELLAQIIQANSPRRHKPFVKMNAGGIPNELLESELFGSEAGAFTGAQKRRIGRFEEAHEGTLFLDEIGNLSLIGQMKLLRVLQSGEFSRLGSNRVISSDVRVVSATNTDLEKGIGDGTFREDLYFRLNVVEINVPALSARPGDILPLARHFLAQLSGAEDKVLGPESEQALLEHPWHGNVRELHNRIQRALLMSAKTFIVPADLGLDEVPVKNQVADRDNDERLEIEAVLRATKGNVSKAAEMLNISRQAFYRRMDKYGVVLERRPQT